jgi:hypothetical protein
MRTEARTIAEQRILRLAVGTSVTLFISQALGWNQGYIAAVLAATLLAVPMPAPGLKTGLTFLVVLASVLILGLLMVPMLDTMALAGLLLLILLFFHLFLFGARGGSPVLVTLAITGLAVVPVVGVLSQAVAIAVIHGLLKSGVLAVAMLWIAHALFPDPPLAGAGGPPAPPRPTIDKPVRLAARSTLVTLPVIVWILATGATSAIGLALKVASMGQQAGAEDSRQAGRALLLSTLIGGLAAIAIWLVLRVWPSLLLYSLSVLLCGLLLGPRIFAGPALAPAGPVWSYGYVTMLIIIGPVVMDSGDAAGARFVDRLLLFLFATLYSVATVWFFDHLIRERRARGGRARGSVTGSA